MAALTQDRLKELLSYDPQTGTFRWIRKPAVRANRIQVGDVAGCLCKTHGYIMIGIDGVVYRAARLVWLYVHGEFPEFIDHENTCRSDDRLDNLRVATRSQNQANRQKQVNNTSGYKGVTPHQGKWVARVTFKGRTLRRSGIDTPEMAAAIYNDLALKVHGDFARINGV